MRTILMLTTALFTTSAMAGTLPLAGSYGDSYGCKVGQLNSYEDTSSADWNADWILVTPNGASGHEWGCTFKTMHGTKITALCNNAGDPDTRMIITAKEDRPAGTLTYTDAGGTWKLHRCH